MNEEKTSATELKPPETSPSPGSGLQQRAKEAAQTAKKEIETLKSAAREEGSAAVEQIKTAVGIPLVLHGGSSNPDAELSKAVKLGINKINISSDIKVAYHDKMREVLADTSLREPNSIQPPCIEAMQEVAAQKIHLFDAAGKADLY